MKFIGNILILFFLLFAELVFCQDKGGIKGIVKDSISGEALPYANIQVIGTKLGTNSSVNGNYIIKDIPVGTQAIQVSVVGYKRYIANISVKKDELMFLNILVSPDPVELPSVTKISERIKEVYETNISVQAITQEQLKIIPLTVEKDIFRALKVVPGISSTGDVTSQFYVRGGGGDQNLILFDNMMVYNPYHAFGLFSIFNADAIKVSEILTGGFGPEFGGRLSSVINIITKEGNRNNFSGKFNLGMLSGQASLEGPIPGGAFFLSYRQSFFDQILKKFLKKEVPLAFYDCSGKVTFDISKEGKISINGLMSRDDIINPKISEPDYQWNNNAFGINLQSFLDHYYVDVSFSYSMFKAYLDPKLQGGKSKSESIVSNFFFNSKVDYYFGNNDILSVGANLFFPNMEYSLTNNARFNVHNMDDLTQAGIFVKYKFTQIDKFAAEIGVRNSVADLGGKTAIVLEPRVNLKYQILPNIALKGSYTLMSQPMVTTSNEDDIIPIFEIWVPIKKPFSTESSKQYVFGFDGSLFESFNMQIQGYYKTLDNFVGYNLEKKQRTDPDFSLGTGKSYGLESVIKFDYNSIFGWITYSLGWAEKTSGSYTFPPRYDKRHNLNVILGTKLPGDINISLNLEVSSGMPFTPIIAYYDRLGFKDLPVDDLNESGDPTILLGSKNSKRMPTYNKLDMSLSKSFIITGISKVNVNLDIINVYDQKNIFYYNKETGERINMLPFMPTLSLGVEL